MSQGESIGITASAVQSAQSVTPERDRSSVDALTREATLREAMASIESRRLPGPERSATVTPLDLRQAKFSTAFRGFDRQEVMAFLLEIGDGYEQALRDNERLRQDIARLETSLVHYRELENSLKSTMLTAQRLADSMRETATKEASRIVREAEGQAELLMNAALAKAEDVHREIDGLRLKRREAESSLESIISTLHHTLEFVRDQDLRERRDNVVPHRTPATRASHPLPAAVPSLNQLQVTSERDVTLSSLGDDRSRLDIA